VNIVLPNFTHICTKLNWCSAVRLTVLQLKSTFGTKRLTSVTLASTNNALPEDNETAPKHIRAILM